MVAAKEKNNSQLQANQRSESNKDYSKYTEITDEQLLKIRKRKEELMQDIDIVFWEEPIAKIHWIPVDGGEIRVLHNIPKNPVGNRPVIFISGWQTMPYQFVDLYKILHERVEIYFIETREKYTSKIPRRKTDFSLSQNAKDIQNTINYFNLQSKDFVLFGTCWGASTILQGLLDGTLKAPTMCTFSPMHKFWFNKFILKYLIPFVPSFVITFLMRTLAHIIFIGEKAETQKNRMQRTMKEGEAWKWKKSARAAIHFELFGKLSTIEEEVLVISGTHDRVHKGYDYPRFADELPNGRFFHFGIDESEREKMLGVLIYELALTTSESTPTLFEFFKREIV